MKITVTTSPKGFEIVNQLLATAVENLQESMALRTQFKMTEKHIKQVESFRQSLVKGFKKTAEG